MYEHFEAALIVANNEMDVYRQWHLTRQPSIGITLNIAKEGSGVQVAHIDGQKLFADLAICLAQHLAAQGKPVDVVTPVNVFLWHQRNAGAVGECFVYLVPEFCVGICEHFPEIEGTKIGSLTSRQFEEGEHVFALKSVFRVGDLNVDLSYLDRRARRSVVICAFALHSVV